MHKPLAAACLRGHLYDGHNLMIVSGKRRCRACHVAQNRLYRTYMVAKVKPSQRKKCPKGHLYTGDNLIVQVTNGKKQRRCRKCKNAKERARTKLKLKLRYDPFEGLPPDKDVPDDPDAAEVPYMLAGGADYKAFRRARVLDLMERRGPLETGMLAVAPNWRSYRE